MQRRLAALFGAAALAAALAAHVEDRSQQSEIARQYIEEARVDVIPGGGEDRWYPAGNPGAFPDTCRRTRASRAAPRRATS
jgi:alkaline phosphatase